MATQPHPVGSPEPSTPSDLGFAGAPHDAALGQVHLRARWLSPGTGRFLSRDPFAGSPASPQSLAPYAYAHNDPVGNIDPTGRCVVGVCDGSGSGGGGGGGPFGGGGGGGGGPFGGGGGGGGPFGGGGGGGGPFGSGGGGGGGGGGNGPPWPCASCFPNLLPPPPPPPGPGPGPGACPGCLPGPNDNDSLDFGPGPGGGGGELSTGVTVELKFHTVFADKPGGSISVPFNHGFIIIFDAFHPRHAFSAYPTNQNPLFNGYGPMVAESFPAAQSGGRWISGWDPITSATRVFSINRTFFAIKESLERFVAKVNNAQITYFPSGPNSNSFVYQAMVDVLGQRTDWCVDHYPLLSARKKVECVQFFTQYPDVYRNFWHIPWAPGWGERLVPWTAYDAIGYDS